MYYVMMIENYKKQNKNYTLRTVGVFLCFWKAINYLESKKNNNLNNLYFIKENK